MDFKTILVHLDHTDRCSARVAFAAGLARAHGSHLIGLVPTGLYDGVIPADAIPTGVTDFIAESADHLRRRAEAISESFKVRVSGPIPVSHEIRLTDGTAVDAIVQHGRSSDLIVLGQEDRSARSDAPAHGLVPRVMLQAGRPVLVVPYAGSAEPKVKNVFVAWDGSRASAVAMRAALPLLAKARQVKLVFCRRLGEPHEPARLLVAETLQWLQRHGIKATAEEDVIEIDIAAALLSRACDLGADLMVMGGYGHSRLREMVLGGVTQQILAHMTFPILIAH
ncbi:MULTISPECIES: universal stress protein [unclassified Variovorax]|uniref:universal stress protein n=1 Tax=unclassified Variovorax TaxID=663243 RepID=UPI003ED0BACD